MRDKYLKALKETVCFVEFTKKDGSLREMYCTLKEDLMELPDRPLKKVTPEVATGPLSVWDLENKGWRSFNPDSVIAFIIGEPMPDGRLDPWDDPIV